MTDRTKLTILIFGYTLLIAAVGCAATAKPHIDVQQLQDRIDTLEMRILILELMHEHGEPIDKTGAIES